jgi:hypothetical protein
MGAKHSGILQVQTQEQSVPVVEEAIGMISCNCRFASTSSTTKLAVLRANLKCTRTVELIKNFKIFFMIDIWFIDIENLIDD